MNLIRGIMIKKLEFFTNRFKNKFGEIINGNIDIKKNMGNRIEICLLNNCS